MIKVHILYFHTTDGTDNIFVCYTHRELYETLFAQLDEGDENDLLDASQLKVILDNEDYVEAEFRLTPPSFNLAPGECYPGEDLDGIFTGWARLQEMNRTLKAEVFGGFVAKRADSLYPLQNRSADTEFPGWVKHRWAY